MIHDISVFIQLINCKELRVEHSRYVFLFIYLFLYIIVVVNSSADRILVTRLPLIQFTLVSFSFHWYFV